jgi:cobalt/nickel transport system permease protein
VPEHASASRVDPRVLLLITLAATAVVVTTPAGRWIDFALWAGAILAAALGFRLSLAPLLHRLAHALPLLLLLALTIPVSVPGHPVASCLGFTVTREGLALAASVVARAALAIALLACLTVAAPAPRLLEALRGLRCPAALVMILGLLHRQLSVIAGEWRRMARAAHSRSPAPRLSGRHARALSTMTATLLVRSLDKSERVHRAMAARGFSGDAAAVAPNPLTARDWIALAMGLTAIAALRVAAVLLG